MGDARHDKQKVAVLRGRRAQMDPALARQLPPRCVRRGKPTKRNRIFDPTFPLIATREDACAPPCRPPHGGAGGAAGLGQVAMGGGEGLARGEAGAAGGVLAGAAGGDAGAAALEVATDDPLMLLSCS